VRYQAALRPDFYDCIDSKPLPGTRPLKRHRSHCPLRQAEVNERRQSAKIGTY
jgi:hypothetical protein